MSAYYLPNGDILYTVPVETPDGNGIGHAEYVAKPGSQEYEDWKDSADPDPLLLSDFTTLEEYIARDEAKTREYEARWAAKKAAKKAARKAESKALGLSLLSRLFALRAAK
jgi:hypothetical protein